MRKRFSRIEQTERNRERVLAMARRLFLDKGYHAASIDGVAEEAGFSKGVVYSQFGSKADLFFALLEQRIEERATRNLEAIAGKPAVVALRALWELGGEARRADRAWSLLVIEFRIHAARDPELRRRYSEMHRRTLDGIAALIERVAFQDGHPPPFSAHDLARLGLALDSGYALEEAIDHRGWSTAPGGAALAGLIEGFAHSPPLRSHAGRSR